MTEAMTCDMRRKVCLFEALAGAEDDLVAGEQGGDAA